MSNHIFNKEQLKMADNILSSSYSKLSKLYSSEIKNLCCAWCYYSGKIEGNTYTYVETEALLKDDITSEKRYEDAKMLKNLYNAFNSELAYIRNGVKENISETTLLRLHQLLSAELVSQEESGTYRKRAVRIGGTDYIPPRDIYEIRSCINNIFFEQEQYENPLEKAVFLHCNIARTQPFIDGNKRTSRLMESIVLMNADIIPVFSTKSSDILNYRKALINFYENKDYSLYSSYFLNRQIENIKALDIDFEK